MKDFSAIKWHDETVDNAVRLSKLNFVEYYTKHGYPPNDVGRGWHELRVSKKGRDHKAELDRKIPGRPDTDAFVNTDAPDPPVAEKKKKVKEVEKDSSQKDNHEPTKKERIMTVYESGITDIDSIVKETGLRKAYVKLVISKI